MRKVNLLKSLAISLMLVSITSSLYAGGSEPRAKDDGWIKNGNGTYCVGETVLLEVITKLPIVTVEKWEYQIIKGGKDRWSVEIVKNPDGTPYTGTSLPMKFEVDGIVEMCVYYIREKKPIRDDLSETFPAKTRVESMTVISGASTPGLISNNQYVVPTSVPSKITGEDGNVPTGSVNYSWMKSLDQSVWSSIPSSNTKDYSPPQSSQTTYYRRVTHNEFGGCTSYSNEVKVEVVSAAIFGTEGEYCVGSQVKPLNVNILSSIEPQIQWEKKRGDNGVWEQISGAVSMVHTPAEVVPNTYRYRAKISWVNGTQTIYTNEKRLVFHPALSGGSITPAYQSVIAGLSPMQLTQSNISGGSSESYTYQWEKQELPSSAVVNSWNIIPNFTGATYQAVVGEKGNYRCIVSSGNCIARSNIAEILQEPLKAGTIGHNATIGLHGRHRPLISVTPSNGREFKWETRSNNRGTWGAWGVLNGGWSTNDNYSPSQVLSGSDGTIHQYRRWARVVSTDSIESNTIEILMSAVDPGSIMLSNSRTRVTQYDTIGKISEEPGYYSSFGTRKLFRWQVRRPGTDWVDLTDWGDSIRLKNYQDISPLSELGEHTYRRQFVQDETNKNDETYFRTSNEVSIFVEPLQGGNIHISDTILDINTTPGTLTNVTSGTGKYYQWQYRETLGGPWSNLTEWSTEWLQYIPSSPMNVPFRQYRRLCKTLLSTSDDLAQPSNSITVRVQSVNPGFISVSHATIPRGGRTDLINIESGTGTVFKWQMSRKNEDGTWGVWNTLGTDVFSPDKLSIRDVNITSDSKYRRLSKANLGENDLWVVYSNEVSVNTEPLKGGTIARNQTILQNGLPSKFTNVEASNGEAYQWVRKRKGESDFRPVTDFLQNEKEYQEVEPVNVTTHYRRIVKSLISSDDRDTSSSNIITVDPSITLNPGAIAISSSRSSDTIVDKGTYLTKFYSSNNGNATVFKWQKKISGTWTDMTDWGNYTTYLDASPIRESAAYRRCAKSHRSNSDDLTKYSNELTITVSNGSGGIISGDTIVNSGDLPGRCRNVTLGAGNLYKWQKKAVGNNTWIDITDWSSSNTDYIESSGLLKTTYYRRLNKDENGSAQSISSSNVITVMVLGLEIRDETLTAEDCYFTLEEANFGITDEMLINRSQVRSVNNATFLPVPIIRPVSHNIGTKVGTYRAVFSTEKGTSKVVKVYVVEDYQLTNGILLFAHNFNLYTADLQQVVSDDLLISRSEARGYDLNSGQVVSLVMRDRSDLDVALNQTPPLLGTYSIDLGYLEALISVDVTIVEETKLRVNFDVNFDDVNNQDRIQPKEFLVGTPYGNLPRPVQNGSEFLYWSLDVEGLTPIESTTIVGSLPGTTEEHTLYAIWKYPVTLELNGGQGQNVIFVRQYYPYQYFQQFPVPQRRGYRFVGWSFDKEGKTMIDGSAIVENKNTHILYAIWEAREIIVVFDALGGTVSENRKVVIFGDHYGELPVPKYAYYKFKGWFMADAKEVLSKNTVDTVAVEIVLYARYQTYAESNNDRYVITPNGDGLNDRFYLQFLWSDSNLKIKDVNVYIYDRKGVMVYYQENYQDVDGEFDGGNLSDGTYIVVVHYTQNEEKKVYNATLTITR